MQKSDIAGEIEDEFCVYKAIDGKIDGGKRCGRSYSTCYVWMPENHTHTFRLDNSTLQLFQIRTQ